MHCAYGSQSEPTNSARQSRNVAVNLAHNVRINHLLVFLLENLMATIESHPAQSAVTKYRSVPGYLLSSTRVSSLTLVPDNPNPARGAAIQICLPRPDLDELIRPPFGWHCSLSGSEVDVSCRPTDSELLEHLCKLLSETHRSSGLFDSWWGLRCYDDRKAALTSMLELPTEDATDLGPIFASRMTKLILRYRELGVDLLKASISEMECLRAEDGFLPS